MTTKTRLGLWAVSLAAGAALSTLGLVSGAALAGDATLKMRGGDFTFTGTIRSYDATKYVIAVPNLGTMTLDATRFDCVAGDCPRSERPNIAPAAAAPVTGGDVTFRMRGGDFTFTGKLLSADNTKYVIRMPSLGTLTLDAARFDCVSGECPGSAGAARTAANVDEGTNLTLKMRGSDFTFTGKLLTYDTVKYIIRTPSLGALTLDATRFDCVSGNCPKVAVNNATAVFSPASVVAPTVTIAGSTTVGDKLMPALIEAYAKSINARATKVASNDPSKVDYKLTSVSDQEVATISVARAGTSSAFTELARQKADIAMASRQVRNEELQRLSAAGIGNLRQPGSEHVLGLDGVMVLVAPNNALVSLTLDQLARVFSGRITDWAEFGLPSRKINLYAPSDARGGFEAFNETVLKSRNMELSSSVKRSESLQEISDLVAKDPDGIGIGSFSVQRNAKPVNVGSVCGLISPANSFTVKAEEYPLGQRLFLYTNKEPTEPVARGLLNFALSPAAQAVIKQADFIDQTPEKLPYAASAGRIAIALNAPREQFDLKLMNTLIDDLKSAERLSLTFRFQTGSDALDSKAQADVARLHELLNTPAMRGAQVMLVGFADGVGRFDNNLRLSQRRAQAVQTALTAFRANNANSSNTSLALKAYGVLAPVGCNELANGRFLNRRVEVWVKK